VPKGLSETTPPVERAVLVLVNEDPAEDDYVEEELSALCEAAGIDPVGSIRQRVDHPSTATYIGKGKVDELHAAVKDERADLALFDCELSAVQQRNLADALKLKVVDRTQLILDIFAQRAHTREGILQVELAQYTYLLPKITSVYTQFERQRGGIGMRGPGEQKLEADRRRIRDRIAQLKRELEDVRAQRSRQRAGRRKAPFPFACLVGYTSAGKSTLMNSLSGSEVFADPMLFATLDPTTRRIELNEGYSIYLTDTVGFVRNLPTNLVAAFRATLEEVTEADFLIHLVDMSHPDWQIQRDAVIDTLQEIGAGDKPIVTAYNKIDLVTDGPALREAVATTDRAVAISARTRAGFEDLQDVLLRTIRSMLTPVEAVIPYDKSGLIDECYRFGRVISLEHGEDGIHVRAELVSEMADRLLASLKP
jgi:GTP-binding protein HflX